MANPFRIFKIRRNERALAGVIMLLVVALNVMMVVAFFPAMSVMHGDCERQILDVFNVSGFDAHSYYEITSGEPRFETTRHPLFFIYLYPLYLLNQPLTALTGVNCMQPLMALLLVFCSFYGHIFLFRILREVVGIRRREAALLTLLCLSMASMMISVCVPDHFILSFFLLMLTLYVAGRRMNAHRVMTAAETAALFILTAGVSLTNGAKTFLASLFANGKRFFSLRNLLLGVILPTLVILGITRLDWYCFTRPMQQRAKAEKIAADKHYRDSCFAVSLAAVGGKDTVAANALAEKAMQKKMRREYEEHHRQPIMLHSGKPIENKGLLSWTDMTSDRWQTLRDNLFGESIQLHRDHLLKDTLEARPEFVSYRSWLNDAVELIIILLFLTGIVCGLRSRFLWLCLSFFAVDLALHLGLGFGINEVYIMGAHFLFVIPVALAFIFKRLRPESAHWAFLALCGLLTLWLFAWNGTLLAGYLLG